MHKTPAWVSRVLNGYHPVPVEFSDHLSRLVGMPAGALFYPASPVPPTVRLVTAAEDLTVFVEASRLAQGLPPRITDPTVLAKVAAILSGARKQEAVV